MGEKIPALRQKLRGTPPTRLIVISFFLVILAGAVVLTLPVCTRSGEATPFIDALFTATSATCVTGLVVFDTWTHWNAFGQAVVLLLIQVGGLGVVTFTTGFTLLMKRRLGLRDMLLAEENTSGDPIGIIHLIRMILSFTFSCEIIGAMLLMLRFVPKFGLRGVWISFFTSISAYCNAGFDILGFELKDGSLTKYVGDPLVCLTVGALIVTGGLGFVVIGNLYRARIRPRLRREHPSRLNFHSTIVLITTGILIVVGTVLFFVCEYDNTLKGLDFGAKLNASLFQSVSARTAGFASVDIAREHDFTKIITVILMFIGASPASTGGGIKTTTFVVLVATVLSVMRGNEDTVVLRRRVDKFVVYRSLAIVSTALLLVLTTTGIILTCNAATNGVDALFEAASAFGTVGLSASVTPTLTAVSKVAVICTMYIGRVGPVSLGLALTLHRGRSAGSAVLPEGKIIVG